MTDLHEYLEHLLKSTNMKSLTPDKAMSGECGFMAANLYAKSIFSEDALANVSLEKNPAKPDAAVTGIFFKKNVFFDGIFEHVFSIFRTYPDSGKIPRNGFEFG